MVEVDTTKPTRETVTNPIRSVVRVLYESEELERALRLLVGMADFGPAFQHYCKLLERHIWNPIMEGRLIQCDLSPTGRPLMDLLQEYDERNE